MDQPFTKWTRTLGELPFDHLTEEQRNSARALAQDMSTARDPLVEACAKVLVSIADGDTAPWDALPYLHAALELLAGEPEQHAREAAQYELETLLPVTGRRVRSASPDVPLSALKRR